MERKNWRHNMKTDVTTWLFKNGILNNCMHMASHNLYPVKTLKASWFQIAPNLRHICFPQLGPSLLPYTLMWVSAVAGFMDVWTQKGQKLIVLYRAPPQPTRSNYEIAAPAASCALCSSSILAFPPPSKDWSWGSNFIALGFLFDRCSNLVDCGSSVFS